MQVVEGEILAGKFRIERVLGRGGMGVVVVAHHLALDEKVAIKFLLPESVHSADAIVRFEREARAAVKIRSEHVARVSDVGRLESGAPYMVMELLRGSDLSQLLEQRGPLPIGDVADYILQACEAIAEAHELGIVHRDLKPQNMFLTERADGSSCVKVLDFGISKMTGAGSSSEQDMTATSVALGSPLYMSPEQLMSARDVDARTDIWALGVICFELLTGKTPFTAASLPQLCMAISVGSPLSLSALRSDVPLGLEALLLRCLEKDRTRRVASVAEFANELVKFAPPHAQLSAARISRLARNSAQRSGPNRALPGATSEPALPLAPTLASGAPVVHTLVERQTAGTFGGTQHQKPKPRKLGLSLAVAGLAALAIGAGWSRAHFAAPESSASAVTASAPAPMEPRPSPAAVTTPAPPVPSPAVEPRVPAPSANPSSSAASAAQSVARVQPHTPANTVAHAGLVSTSAARLDAPAPVITAPTRPAADCDIPYFFDSRGNKIFKKGCL